MALKPAGRNLHRMQPGQPRRTPIRRFIPDGDIEFAQMARFFAEQISRDPSRYAMSADDVERITQTVIEFRDALAKARHRHTRNVRATMLKDQARAQAVKVIRKYGELIRLNEEIPVADKFVVGVREKRKAPMRSKRSLPAPDLRFVGATHHAPMSGHKHILRFHDWSESAARTRPQGAARLELFVELVEPQAPIPQHPGELSGGRMWYVRSYTRSPIQVEFPVTNQPMRVVYWARWADTKGNVGPFCQTVKARVEGWDGGGRALPNLMDGRARQQKIVITSAIKELPDYAHAARASAEAMDEQAMDEQAA